MVFSFDMEVHTWGGEVWPTIRWRTWSSRGCRRNQLQGWDGWSKLKCWYFQTVKNRTSYLKKKRQWTIKSTKQFLGVFQSKSTSALSHDMISLVYQVVTRETKEELEGRFEEKYESGKINRFASRSIICKMKAMHVEGTFWGQGSWQWRQQLRCWTVVPAWPSEWERVWVSFVDTKLFQSHLLLLVLLLATVLLTTLLHAASLPTGSQPTSSLKPMLIAIQFTPPSSGKVIAEWELKGD